ncbi:trimeric intracellular cation channel family protein [Ktedonosporobacter rubrisoli]|uniref:Trimeric intracellular cation channel family protein n=1 Tax=Ktedonosporobacter rubrisoli TaxID=2509675 RepID=A0A4V0YYL3_KTERU|nr:trimeric intracellular cation channel family protein [Ktedonosporobacter rubrisoli]QBD76621.1 trimeric intracellular cation channel family protein [Ktedonosporobacter rubrisoli]
MHPVVFNPTLEEVLNFVGTFVFAVSGSLLAVRKSYDIVGMAVLAVITAIGGGVIRDLVIGAVPPAAFQDVSYLWIPLLATILTFFAHVEINRLRAAMLIFDAAGLAVFCVSGTAKALNYGLGPGAAIALGTLTAVGGGIMRDVLAHDEPAIFLPHSELYALPAVVGSVIVVFIPRLPLNNSIAAGLTAVFVFVLRLLALRFGWKAPRPWRTTRQEESDES